MPNRALKTFSTRCTIPVFLIVLFTACSPAGHKNGVIRLAYLQSDLHHLPAFIALEEGFYQQEGLSVEVAGVFKAGPEMMSAFASGSLDAGYVGLAPVVVATANQTARLTVIAQVNENGSALIVKKGAPYESVADLVGRVIAIPGHATIQDFLLRKALFQAGITSRQVTVITIKPPEMISVLMANQIDAFMAWEPYPSLAITKKTGVVLTASKNIWPNHPCCVLVVSEVLLKENSSQVEALQKAHRKAIAFISEKPEEAVRIGALYTGMDRKTVELAAGTIHYDYQLDAGQVSEYLYFLNKLGYTSIAQPELFLHSLMVPQG